MASPFAVMASPFAGRIEVGLLYFLEMTYVYYLVLRLRKGVPRLLALLPLLPLSHVVVCRAPTAFERIICCVFFMWYFLFKLLLLAWDKGLGADSLSSFPRFLYACQFAVHLEQDPQFSHTKKSGADVAATAEKMSQAVGLKKGMTKSDFSSWVGMMATSQALHVLIARSLLLYVVATSLVRSMMTFKYIMPDFVFDLLTGLLVYFFASLLFDVAVVIPASVFEAEVPPLMNMPFLADSLGDFWSRRWNLVVINLGRVSVYEPMLNLLGGGKKKPSLLDRAIAIEVVFLVSGLTHELALFYATWNRPSWEMTTFFLVNGVGTIVERVIMKSKYSFEVPRILRWGYTFTFLYLTGHWYFCPPGRAELRAGLGDLDALLTLKWKR